MTTGNISTSKSNPPVPRYLYYSNGSVEYQGMMTISESKSRVWDGGDRPKAVDVRPRPQGKKRYYTIPVVVKDRRGRPKTILVTKSFREFREPSRVRRDLSNRPNAYSCTFSERKDESTIWRNPIQWGGVWGEGSATSFSAWPAMGDLSFNSNDQIKLVGKLKSAIQGSDFNLAVFAAEGRQTMNMIASTAVRIAQAYRATRKGNFLKAKQYLVGDTKKVTTKKASASNWLELQYGWLPLLGDMKSGAEQLAHILIAPKTKRYKVSIKKTFDTKELRDYSWLWEVHKSTNARYLTAHLTEQPSLLGISGLLDPELVAWELLPFSFIADWVVPIGDYLEARAFSRRLTGTFVTTDFSYQYCKNLGAQKRPPGDVAAGNVSKFDSNGIYSKVISINRTISSTLVVPMPVVKPISKIASWQHMANGLALLVQAFKNPGSKNLDRKLRVHQEKSNSYWNDIVDKSKGSF